jgi:hypothetical protein
MGCASGLRSFCESSQKELTEGYPTKCLAIPRATNPLNRTITKNIKRISHPTRKLEQRTMICFFPLNGFQPEHVQTERSDMSREQAFQLPTVEKWHLYVADRIGDLEDEPKSGRPKKTDLVGRLIRLLHKKPFTSCKAICRRLEILKTIFVRVLLEELALTKFYWCRVPGTLDANEMAERVTLSRQLLQMFRSDEEQNFSTIMTRDESWFFLIIMRYLIRLGPELICLHNPNKIFRRKSVSFRLFDLPVVFMACSLFQKESIIVQNSSPMLLFQNCTQIFAQKHGERCWNVGQCIWTTLAHNSKRSRKFLEETGATRLRRSFQKWQFGSGSDWEWPSVDPKGCEDWGEIRLGGNSTWLLG